MKYIALIVLSWICIFTAMSQEKVIRVVQTQNYGELWSQIENDYENIDSLVVSGPISADDFESMWKCSLYGKLSGIDLSKAQPENNCIPDNAFYHKSEQYPIPAQNIKVIKLNWFTFPENVESIGSSAFYLSPLYEINMPNTVTTVGDAAFSKSFCLNKIVLSENLTELPRSCFDMVNCKSITLPKSVKIIRTRCFAESTFEEIIMPEDGLEIIEENALFECFYLKKLVMPNSVVSFGKKIFGDSLT